MTKKIRLQKIFLNTIITVVLFVTGGIDLRADVATIDKAVVAVDDQLLWQSDAYTINKLNDFFISKSLYTKGIKKSQNNEESLVVMVQLAANYFERLGGQVDIVDENNRIDKSKERILKLLNEFEKKHGPFNVAINLGDEFINASRFESFTHITKTLWFVHLLAQKSELETWLADQRKRSSIRKLY